MLLAIIVLLDIAVVHVRIKHILNILLKWLIRRDYTVIVMELLLVR